MYNFRHFNGTIYILDRIDPRGHHDSAKLVGYAMTTHQHSKFLSKSKTWKKAVVLKCWILHLGYCAWTSKSFKRTWGHQHPQFLMNFQCHVDLPVMDADFYQLFNTKTQEIHDDFKSDTTILLAGLSDISHI